MARQPSKTCKNATRLAVTKSSGWLTDQRTPAWAARWMTRRGLWAAKSAAVAAGSARSSRSKRKPG